MDERSLSEEDFNSIRAKWATLMEGVPQIDWVKLHTPPDTEVIFDSCINRREDRLEVLVQARSITKNEFRKVVGLPEVSEPWGNEIVGSGQEQVLTFLRTEMESFKSKGQIAVAASILSVIKKVDPKSKGFTIVGEKEVRIKGQSSEG